jgi:short-subunit dehydrogenase
MTIGSGAPRRVLVTGASKGIGRAIARLFRTEGFAVLGTSRTPSGLADALEGVEYLRLDLRDPASIDDLVLRAGPVDILINNAGESQVWPAADTPLDKVRGLFEANLFGQIRLIQGLLPGMIGRGRGLIVNVGSMTGKFAVPFQSAYSASKFALAGFTWSLRNEVRDRGVDVVMLEPGHIRTGIAPEVYAAPGSPFRAKLDIVAASRARHVSGGSSPDLVARKTLKIVRARRPRPFYASGGKAPLMVFAKRLFSNRFVENLIRKIYGL